jgi:hypothetical protein
MKIKGWRRDADEDEDEDVWIMAMVETPRGRSNLEGESSFEEWR